MRRAGGRANRTEWRETHAVALIQRAHALQKELSDVKVTLLHRQVQRSVAVLRAPRSGETSGRAVMSEPERGTWSAAFTSALSATSACTTPICP